MVLLGRLGGAVVVEELGDDVGVWRGVWGLWGMVGGVDRDGDGVGGNGWRGEDEGMVDDGAFLGGRTERTRAGGRGRDRSWSGWVASRRV